MIFLGFPRLFKKQCRLDFEFFLFENNVLLVSMWKKRYGFFARVSSIFEETFLHCHFDRSLLIILYRFYCFKVDI